MCERAREWASLRLDGELSELERALLDAHTRNCAACAEYVADDRSAHRRDPLGGARAAAAARRPAAAPQLRAGRPAPSRRAPRPPQCSRSRPVSRSRSDGAPRRSARRSPGPSAGEHDPVGPELRERRAHPRAEARGDQGAVRRRSPARPAHRHVTNRRARGDYAVDHDGSRLADHLALLKPRPRRPCGGRARVPPPPRGEP